MNKKTLLAFIVGAFIANGSQAQEHAFSLKECLEAALKNNQNIAISRYEEQIGEHKITETRSRALPQVNGTGNFTDNFKKQVIVLPGEFVGQPGKTIAQEMGTTYNTAVALEANQAIFDMAAFTGIKASKAARDYYKVNTARTEDEVINSVSQLYYQILAFNEQIKVIDTNIARLNNLVVITEGQYKNGLARKIDLDRIKVNLTNAQTQKLESDNRLQSLYNNLKVQMAYNIDEPLELSDLPLQAVEEKATGYILNSEFNLANRNEIRLLDAQRDLYALQVKAIKAEYYPRLSAFFSYNYNGISNDFGDLWKKNGSDIWYGVGAFGARLNIPIFDGFARRSRVAQARISLLENEKQREYTALQLTAGFRNSQAQMLNNISAIKAQRDNVKLASEVYASSQENYKLGLATLTDLLDAQSSFVDARNSYTQALFNYKIAELESIRSTGNLRSLLQ
ncbi:MAG TPA: TolC family protein [Flavipsychrobacter sp.]|nr:TolC family protein [Flavipsychrobacter sp.]